MCAGELIFLGKVPSFVKLGGGPAAGFPALASIAGQPGKGNRPEGGGRRFLAAPRIFPWKSPLFAVWEVMPSFIYITDVFCPWCFGFAPVMQELAEEYRFPVRVLCGELVDDPTPTSKMGTPTLLAFFERLSSTTGREIGKGFFELLTPEKSVLMDSRRSAGLMAALKKLAPGYALEQMERFQDVFYVEGRDVLDPAVQADAASRWGVDAAALAGALASEVVQGKAEKELEEAEEILGDFVVYPSLFVKTDDGSLHAVARGYAPYAEVKAKIEKALACSGPDCEAGQSAVSANACGLDGKGCC